MNELALFAGAGGGILGGHLLGWRTRCAVEVDAYARALIAAHLTQDADVGRWMKPKHTTGQSPQDR